jgi:hypothetical protein
MERKPRPMDYSLVHKVRCPRKKHIKPKKSFQKIHEHKTSIVIVSNSSIMYKQTKYDS